MPLWHFMAFEWIRNSRNRTLLGKNISANQNADTSEKYRIDQSKRWYRKFHQ